MPDRSGYATSRIPVASEPLLEGTAYDYADSFELRLDAPDAHSAEQWVRAALEEAPPSVRRVIQFAHSRLLRFWLSELVDDDHIIGWRIVSSTPDVLHLQATGSLMRAVIVARRTAPTRAVVSTFVFHERPVTRLLWVVVAPVHRRVVPLLLAHAAARWCVKEAHSSTES